MQASVKSRQQSQSMAQIDFIPPQHKYVVNEQFTSAFFRDHCEEQYQIQRAFRPSNFTYLRSDIPNTLKHGAILDQRLNKVQNNLEHQTTNRHKTSFQKQQDRNNRITRRKMQQIGQLGYFQVFPYQESQYDIEHELKLQQQNQSKRKQESISTLDFRPAGFDRKLKYENPFAYIDRLQGTSSDKPQYLFPFHLPDDTYDQFHYSELRQRIIQQGSKIAGDFIPSQNQKSLSKVTRSKIAEILKEIEQYLKKYLSSLGFFIGVSKRDYIDVLFESKELDNSKLQMVMSRLCEDEMLSKFVLRKNVWKWSKVGESGYLQFCILPPWVKDPEEKLSRE